MTPSLGMQLRAAALLPSAAAGAAQEVVAGSPMCRPGYHVCVVRGIRRGGLYLAEVVKVAVLDPFAPSE